MKQRVALIAWSLCLLSILAGPAAKARGSAAAPSSRFPLGPDLARSVWFWEKIFRDYSSRKQVIHDPWYPEVIIDVLTLAPSKHASQRAALETYMARYRLACKRFKDEGPRAVRHGAIERRLWRAYRQRPATLAHLYSGKARIRSQQGLADIFAAAAKRAQPYLPYMEGIFDRQGLPGDLTRLVFVESMFQLDAYSKVGAAGIWQFMPQTARQFITVNHWLDERKSPLKATRAASRLLKEHYRKLKDWPLAITSYNHGVNGIMRAIRRTGSRDLAHIIRRFDSPSFGFASRNFYAEFLAARNIYNRHYASRRPRGKNPLGIVAITLPRRLALAQIIRHTPLTEKILKHHNPCILPQAYSKRYRHQPLPSHYALIVPAGLAKNVRASLKKVGL